MSFEEHRRLELIEQLRALRRRLVADDYETLTRGEAASWIYDHGGSIAAALKATHPDHGGTTEEFQRTLKAREVLEAQR